MNGAVIYPVQLGKESGVREAYRVLVLDDEPAICNLVRDSLARAGHDVVCTQEAEEALAMLEYRPFDVLVADLKLGSPFHTEGLDLIGEARYHAPHLGIVVHTGECDEALHQSCLSNGADEIVLKTETIAALRAAVIRAGRRKEVSDVAS
ncbi:MAG TPA: response regulator, partial [Thermoanaerobaculia bacterium]|jgi:DNA-binding response OmpR family regulator